MSTASNTAATEDQRLREACARNQPIELHYRTARDTVIVARTRLLEINDEYLLVETPSYALGSERIPPGRSVEAHLTIDGTRYRFKTALESKPRLAQLNRETTVRAVALRKPRQLENAQRRAHFRINVFEGTPIHATMVAQRSKDCHVCPIDAKVINGVLINLSVGGLCVLVDDAEPSDIKIDRNYYVCLPLPHDDRELLMLAKVRHHALVKKSGSLRVAMAFLPWDGSNLAIDQRNISRFVAIFQRAALKRTK